MNEDSSGTPARTWVFVTDENGQAAMQQRYLKAGSSELFTDAAGKAVIPAGSFTVQETKAPAGYLADDTVYRYKVNGAAFAYSGAQAGGISAIGTSPALDISKGVTSEESVVCGGVKAVKYDIQRNSAYPQGDAVLEGAQLTGYHNSANAVWHDGAEYARGEAVLTMTTDASGTAQTADNALPYGDYIIKETKPPRGYMPNEDWSVSFSIRENGVVVDISGNPVKDMPVKGGVKFQKIDSETLENTPQGSALLEGAEISVYNISGAPVMVGDALYEPENNADVSALRSSGTPVLTAVTDASGLAQTSDDALPYGTYRAIETKAPEGYELNSQWSVTFQVRENGVIIDTASAA